MKSRLLSIFGVCCCAFVCAISSVSADDKGDREIAPNAPGTIHGGAVPVPESFSTLWLALPAIGMFALVQRRRQKA